jgi:photosystem I protein
MAAQAGADVAQTNAKPPFPYRTLISAILLAGNILVAAIYFHVINP